MAGRTEFEFRFHEPQMREQTRRPDDAAMRILIMGDFSGQGNRGAGNPADLAERPIVAVDVDNFDDILFRFAPRLYLPIDTETDASVEVEFKQLDDFHPDRLYRELDVFAALRETHRRLCDPTTFAETASGLRREAVQRAEPAATAEKGAVLEEDEDSMFERLLGHAPVASPETRVAAPVARTDIQQFINRIVAPYIVPEPDPFQDQYVASVDTAISAQMRSVLHHAAFQSLESSWRGMRWLIDNLETGESLQLYLLNVTKEELRADIESGQGDLSATGLYRLLIEQGVQTLGGTPWSVLVGHYTFAATADDINLLAALGVIGSQTGAPFLAAADSNLLGCRTLAETPDAREWTHRDADAEQRWHALRQSNAAPWIGLAVPRMLLRLPYGKNTDEVDDFEFEEMGPERTHEDYLWGSPALACAMLIGGSFLDRGWNMELGDRLDIDDLPAHTYTDQGESKLQACAEATLTEGTAGAILERGIMPLMSYKNRNAVKLIRFQSVADPVQPLAGPWR
ncbi:MAG: type VI secretion system contractile sheath large subunit [Gammaproteobacteria bacterium]|nr:type VI secretion system contractile sheath large subunit [Gammaproteobacteria bacterium]MDH3465091.1 type VI secretion system contractile sheath large subunit [Gammaproteobacteria bacterium]